MLGPTYRFTAHNGVGQTLAIGAITIEPRRWKYGTDGSITDEASGTADVLNQSASLANNTYKNGNTQDNTALKYLGGFFDITVIAPASSSGKVKIFCDRSVDGGATWPDDGRGEWVATFAFTAAGTQRETVKI